MYIKSKITMKRLREKYCLYWFKIVYPSFFSSIVNCRPMYWHFFSIKFCISWILSLLRTKRCISKEKTSIFKTTSGFDWNKKTSCHVNKNSISLLLLRFFFVLIKSLRVLKLLCTFLLSHFISFRFCWGPIVWNLSAK